MRIQVPENEKLRNRDYTFLLIRGVQQNSGSYNRNVRHACGSLVDGEIHLLHRLRIQRDDSGCILRSPIPYVHGVADRFAGGESRKRISSMPISSGAAQIAGSISLRHL